MKTSPIKIIVRESHIGKKTLQEVFAEIIETEVSQSKDSSTFYAPTVKSKSVLFVSGGKHGTTTI